MPFKAFVSRKEVWTFSWKALLQSHPHDSAAVIGERISAYHLVRLSVKHRTELFLANVFAHSPAAALAS
jgi:hypothetical protein